MADLFIAQIKAELDSESLKNAKTGIDNFIKDTKDKKIQLTIDEAALKSQLQNIFSNIKFDNLGNNAAANAGKNMGNTMGNALAQELQKTTNQMFNSGSWGKSKRGYKISSSTRKELERQAQEAMKEISGADTNISSVRLNTRTKYDKKNDQYLEEIKSATVQYEEAGKTITRTLKYGTKLDSNKKKVTGFFPDSTTYSESYTKIQKETEAFAKKQKQTAANLQNTYNQITSAVNDPNASKHLSQQYSSQLESQQKAIQDAITNLRTNSTQATFDDAKLDIEKMISEYKSAIVQLQNAQYSATSLRTKDVATVKTDELNNLDTFVEKMKQAGTYTTDLQDRVSSLRSQLEGVTDSKGLTSYLNGFSNLQSEWKKVNAQFVTQQKNEKFDTNVQAEAMQLQNMQTAMEEAGVYTGQLKQEFEELYDVLGKATTQSDLTTFRAQLKGVKSDVDAAIDSANKAEKLDTKKSVEDIKLDTIQNKLTDSGLSDSAINELSRKVQTLKSELDKVGDSSGLDVVKEKIKNLSTEVNTAVKEASKLGTQSNQLQSKKDTQLLNLDQLEQLTKDNGVFYRFRTQLQDMRDQINNVSDVSGLEKLVKGVGGFNDLKTEINDTIKIMEKLDTIRQKYKTVNSDFSDIQSKVSSSSTSLLGQSGYEKVTKKIEEATKAQEEFNAELSKGSAADFDKLNSSLQQFTSLTKSATTDYDKLTTPVSETTRLTALNKMQAWGQNNKKALQADPDGWNEILSKFESADLNAGQFEDATKQLRLFKSEMESTGNVGNTVFGEISRGFRDIAQFTLTYGALQRIPEVLNSMAQTVIEVDDVMTDMQMATGITDEAAQSLMNTYSEMGKTLKATGTDIATSATEWFN